MDFWFPEVGFYLMVGAASALGSKALNSPCLIFLGRYFLLMLFPLSESDDSIRIFSMDQFF